jgi:hypothetical protein
MMQHYDRHHYGFCKESCLGGGVFGFARGSSVTFSVIDSYTKFLYTKLFMPNCLCQIVYAELGTIFTMNIPCHLKYLKRIANTKLNHTIKSQSNKFKFKLLEDFDLRFKGFGIFESEGMI